VSDGDGGAKDRPPDEEPAPDTEPAHDPKAASDVESHPDAEPGPDGEPASSPAGRALRFPPTLYFAGFAVVLFSFAALALGGLSLLGRGIDASPTGFFWTSIVLSVVALGLALAALFAPRRR
jgi:hypothetical protein